jgi:maltose-binding protein MalE
MDGEEKTVDRYSPLWLMVGLIGFLVLYTSCSPTATPDSTATIPVVSAAITPSPSTTSTATMEEPTATESPIIQGNISLWLDWTQEEIAILYPHLVDFQSKFPRIQVSISYYPPEELYERFTLAASEGKEPTMLVGSSEWGSELFREGLIRDVSGRVTKDFIETFHPVAWEGVKDENLILGLPFTMEGIVLYRNRDLVSESPMTLDDLVEYSQGIEGEEQIGAVLDVGILQTGSFLQACGGELLAEDGSMALTFSAGRCWLEIIEQWRQAGRVILNTDEDLELFETGRAAWFVDGTWNAPRLMSALGVDRIAIDPWPIYSPTAKELTGYAWARNFYFSASSEESDFNAAWILARYLLTPEVQADFIRATSGSQVPVLLSIPAEERWIQEMLIAMAKNIQFPDYPEFTIFTDYLETAAYDVGRRGYDPGLAISWVLPKIEIDLAIINFEED